jgi:alcohol dehydrogenase
VKQLTYLEGGKVEWREAADPRLEGDGEALVRPVAVATCDLDLMVVVGRVAGPLPAGHEGVGEVIDVGDGVKSVSPGDLVSIPFQVSCGECRNCRRGQTGNCESVGRMATYGIPIGENYGGFLSDLVRVPYADAMLVKIPEGVEPAAVASVSDNVPDAWRAVAPQLAAEPGAPVLICGGAGSIALYAVQIALALGSERVDFAGGRPEHRELADRLGANLLDEEFPDWVGRYPITMDFSATHEGLSCALRSTEPDGHCTINAIYFEEKTPVPLLAMYTNGINVYTGRVHSRPVMEPILDLVAEGKLRPEEVTGETAAWDDAAEAVANHRSKLVISRYRGP